MARRVHFEIVALFGQGGPSILGLLSAALRLRAAEVLRPLDERHRRFGGERRLPNGRLHLLLSSTLATSSAGRSSTFAEQVLKTLLIGR